MRALEAARARSPAATRAAAIALAGIAVLVAVAWYRTESLAGDPYAVYFPVAQNLLRGHGLDSFTPLWQGPGRHPGFPMLIALFGLATGDLIRAAQAISVLSSAAIFVMIAHFATAAGARSRVLGAVVAICCTSWVFLRSAVEALPDAACTAAIAVAAVAMSSRVSSRRGLVLAGVAIGAAVSIRPNAPVFIPAAIISLLLHARREIWRRSAIFLCGLAIGLSPFLAPVIGLRASGMKYPITSTENNLEILPGESGIDALARNSLDGLAELPKRLADTATWPVVLIGLPVLLYAAIGRRNPLAITAAVFLAALCIGLLPFHFEGRYYLFALIVLAPAAAIGVEEVIDRLRVRAALGWVLWAAFVFGVAIYTGRKATKNFPAEHHVAAELRQVCDELARLAARPGATVLAGAGPGQYVYSRFRECPRPLRTASNILLIDALPDDVGLDAYVGASGAELPRGTQLRKVAGQIVVKLDELAVPTATAAPAFVETEPWVIRLPRAPRKTCETRSIAVEPGNYHLEARFRSELPAAARLEVIAGGVVRHLAGAGADRPPVGIDLSVGTDGRVELRLCASDPLRAPGELAMTKLALFRAARR